MWREIDLVIKENEHDLEDFKDLHICAKVTYVPDYLVAHDVAGDLASISAPSIDIEIVTVIDVTTSTARGISQKELQNNPKLAKLVADEVNRVVENLRFDS